MENNHLSRQQKLNQIQVLKKLIEIKMKEQSQYLIQFKKDQRQREKAQQNQSINFQEIIEDQFQQLADIQKYSSELHKICQQNIFELNIERQNIKFEVKEKTDSNCLKRPRFGQIQQFAADSLPKKRKNNKSTKRQAQPTTENIEIDACQDQEIQIREIKEKDDKKLIQSQVDQNIEQDLGYLIGKSVSNVQQFSFNLNVMDNFQEDNNHQNLDHIAVNEGSNNHDVLQQVQNSPQNVLEQLLQAINEEKDQQEPQNPPLLHRMSSEFIPQVEDIDQLQEAIRLNDSEDQFQRYQLDESYLYQQFPKDMKYHPRGYMEKFALTKVTYKMFKKQTRDMFWEKRKIFIPQEAHYLYHGNSPIIMHQFVRYDWHNLIEIFFISCDLDNQGLQTFFDNRHSYPYLKLLHITKNKITTIKEEMLSKFKKLQYLNLGSNNAQSNRELTKQSIEEIKKYKNSHPKTQVICYQLNV